MLTSSVRSVFLLALAPLAVAAQGAVRPLPAPDASFDEPFSSVTALRELPNGKVLVADARDKMLSLVDFKTGAQTKLGREGSGPAEYGLPMRLLYGRGDSAVLFDIGNQRYMSISADGKLGATFMQETAAPPAAGGGARVMSIAMPRTSDARGRMYYESSGFSMGPDGQPKPADSVAILRWDRESKKVDTLAWVAVPKSNAQVSGGQSNMRVMIGAANPLLPKDEWTVFPDGRLAIVRAGDYHVDWVMPNGQKTSGPANKFTPIRMTEAEKKAEEAVRNAARGNQVSFSINNNNGNVTRSAGMGAPPGAPPLEPLTDWPEVKPPFRRGEGSVVAAPNGDLWVRRTTAVNEPKGALWDVIGTDGKVMFQVRLPDRVNLVGFGKNTIYTTLADEDDLLTLRRHSLAEVKLKG
ncbi:MAG: hypothetical protein IT357_09820 [Gemmatimonadaceae bacterium]|nr:hypothetical protein [Gemmatimonadaceae bacterium]